MDIVFLFGTKYASWAIGLVFDFSSLVFPRHRLDKAVLLQHTQ